MSTTSPTSPSNSDTTPEVKGSGAESGSTIKIYKAPTISDCTPANEIGSGAAVGLQRRRRGHRDGSGQCDDDAPRDSDRRSRQRVCVLVDLGLLYPRLDRARVTDDQLNQPGVTVEQPDAERQGIRGGSVVDREGLQRGHHGRLHGGQPARDRLGDELQRGRPGSARCVASNTTSTLRVTATDAAGNESPCSPTSVSYTHDSIAPASPTINGTDPNSPANENNPEVKGFGAEAGRR